MENHIVVNNVNPVNILQKLSHNLLDKQKEFIHSKARYTLYSGGVGSGKTLAGCYKALYLSNKYAGNVGIIGTNSEWQLINTTIDTLMKLIEALKMDIVKYSSISSKKIILKNGSVIHFRTFDKEIKLRSLNLGWFYIDEASGVSRRVWDTLTSRLRLSSVDEHYGFITTNPDSYYHWIYKEFISKQRDNFQVIYAKTYENMHLPQSYIDDMLSKSDEYKDKFVEGLWGISEGLVYKDFQIHINVKDFNYSAFKEYFRSIDYGYVNPFCCLWIGIDQDDCVYVFDEYYKRQKLVSENFKEVYSRYDDFIFKHTYIDPSASETIEYFNRNGISVTKAKNDVNAGIMAVKELLSSNGIIRLFVHSRCENLIREFHTYRWKSYEDINENLHNKDSVKEVPVKSDDHALDALRYFVYSYIGWRNRNTNIFDKFTISTSGTYDFM